MIELRKEVEFNPNLDLKDILDNKELKYYKKTIHKEYGEILEIRETILEFKEIAELRESLDWKHIGGAGRKEEYMEALNKVKGSSKGGELYRCDFIEKYKW